LKSKLFILQGDLYIILKVFQNISPKNTLYLKYLTVRCSSPNYRSYSDTAPRSIISSCMPRYRFIVVLFCTEKWHWPSIRVFSKQTNKKFRFEPKQTISVNFRFVLRNLKKICFGLFRYFEPVSKKPKQIDLFRNKQKETKNAT
jgi:hypothetical protein